MTEQVFWQNVRNSVNYRTGFLLLLSVILGLFPMHVIAQQESDGPSVEDLQSYENLPVKEESKTNHWFQINYGDQWIGWARMESRVLEAAGGNEAEISEYKVSTQVSPQLVKDQLRKTFREEIKKEQEEGQAITQSKLEELVEKRVQARIKQLKKVVERKSKSTTIFRNQNDTLREAKYGFSADQSESFTLYLEPKQLGSGQYTIFIPGKVPGETEVDRSRPVVNQYLAAQIIASDSFQSEQYTFALLDGTSENPLVKTNVKPISDENQKLTIGDKKYEVRPVRVLFPDRSERTEKWWIGTDGVVRKMERMSGGSQEEEEADEKGSEEAGPTLTLTYSSRKEARKGYEFVFARRGRRNPFRPVWPKIKSKEETASDEKGQCADYVAKDVLDQAKTIAMEEVTSVKEIPNKQQRINAQRSLIKEFNGLKGRVMKCGSQEDREKIKKYEKSLQSDIDIGQMIISIVDGLRQSTKEAFDRRAFEQVSTLAEDAMKWKNQLPSDTSEAQKNEFNELLQAIQNFKRRADIRKYFRENAPEVLGVVSSKDDRNRPVQMGISVFGDRISVDLNMNIPDVNSIAIVRSQQGDQSDKAKRPGEAIESKELEEVTLSQVHEDGAVFKYKGESIKVPLLKLKDSVGKN